MNTYHKVVEIIPAKACVRVADTTGLNVNSRVMLIQMKGASISTANNSTFGDTTSLNQAGNYEIGAVCFMIGDSVFLFHNLLNTYNYSTGKVQLVQFAEYYSANVIDTVKAASWDSVASTGGVIAIFATEDITLNAPIYADSSGYAGGVYIHHNGDCPFAGSGFVYDASATGTGNGAYKGEGVANISATQDGAKGAPANGGGGGNNHNNSGGGGANLTTGGNGGGNSSSGPFGCNTVNNWGRGGKALSSWSDSKIFMGGGAGAGHSNNGSVAFNYGGNGGGIIFIWANNLIGNNDSISANGGNGGASQSDGAGGGGAGGTIIMHVTSYIGNVAINVRGGKGGQSDDGIVTGRCFGGGGGGSGGAVYFTGSTPAVTVSIAGGAGGAEINRDAGCNTAVAGAAGSNGKLFANYTFPRSTDPAGYCLLLLPTTLNHFHVQLINRLVELKWGLDHPELVKSFTIEKRTENTGWTTLANIVASDIRLNYLSEDPSPFPGNNFYRLKVTEKNNSVYFSETRKIWVDLFKQDFTIYPNPAIDKVFVMGKFETGKMFRVMDIAGKIVWKQELHNNLSQFELPRLPAGLYLLQYNGRTKKLVIR